MGFKEDLKPTERRIVITSALMLLLSALALVDPDLAARLLGRTTRDGRLELGRIEAVQNDVRRKDDGRYVWTRVPGPDVVADGDAIFTGEKSQADVKLGNGLRLHVPAESLVRFHAIKGEKVIEFEAGGLRLEGQGDARLLVQGRLLRVPLGLGPVDARLDVKKGLTLSANGRPVTAIAEAQDEIPRFPPFPLPETDEIFQWTLYDLYELRDGRLSRRAIEPEKIGAKVRLNWRDQSDGPYEIEIAGDENFQRVLRRERVGAGGFELKNASPVAGFFWRVRRPGESWSDGQFFRPRTAFRPESPRWNDMAATPPYFGQPIEQSLTWTAPAGDAVVIEVSRDPSFPPHETVVHYSKKAFERWSLDAEGTYYFRLASVDENQRLSQFSAAAPVRVATPALLGAAGLPGGELRFVEGEGAVLTWQPPRGAKSSTLEVYDASGRVIYETVSDGSRAVLENLPPGAYSYRITATDQWRRDGRKSAMQKFAVDRAALAEIPRTPAQETGPETSVARTSIPAPLASPNESYANSVLALEGASFLMFSSEQQSTGAKVPIAGTAGLRWKHWWETLGVEWSYRGKIASWNDSAKTLSPTAIEGRIEARTTLGWSWFSFLREIQVAGVLAAEAYRNPGGGDLFVKGYDLVKAGLRLEFPLARAWDTGGEMLYGRAGDASNKFEISGHVNYYLNARWSLGAGYRAHAYSAGSPANVPGTVLPYREAYGEAFSTLRYFY